MSYFTGRYAYKMTPAEVLQEEKVIAKLAGSKNHDFNGKRPSCLTFTHNYRQGFITNVDKIIEKVEIYWYGYAYTGVPLFISNYATDVHNKQCESMVSIHIHPSIPRSGDAVQNATKTAQDAFKQFEEDFNLDLLSATWNRELFLKRFSRNISTFDSTIITGSIHT